MVEYTITKKERKQQINSLFFKSIVGLLVILGICLVATVYFLIIGYVDDADAKGFGFGLLACVILVIGVLLLKYCFLLRNAMTNFESMSKDGQIAMRFENNESQYILSNLTTGNSFKYEKSSISKVKYYKNAIVLYFNGGRTEILPNNEEIRRVGEL